MWGMAGLVPRGTLEEIQEKEGVSEIATFTLLKETAKLILETAHVAWKRRVERTLQWEKSNVNMYQVKTEVMRTTWARGAEVKRKVRGHR